MVKESTAPNPEVKEQLGELASLEAAHVKGRNLGGRAHQGGCSPQSRGRSPKHS